MTTMPGLAADADPEALALVLAPPGQARAPRAVVTGYLDYLAATPIEARLFRLRVASRVTAAALSMRLPGDTAMVLVPAPGSGGIDSDKQVGLLAEVLAELARCGVCFVQALLERECPARAALVAACGFRRIATLTYMERAVSAPDGNAAGDDADDGAVEWLSYGAQTHAQFAETLRETYEQSRDCPELTGLRQMEQVLASHKAAGPFDPALWELARIDGRIAGALLLSRLPRSPDVELVYMGVVPAARGRGVSHRLLRRAVGQCRRARAVRLHLAVDERNAPALAAYRRFGFVSVGRREAYLWVPRGNVRGPAR